MGSEMRHMLDGKNKEKKKKTLIFFFNNLRQATSDDADKLCDLYLRRYERVVT